MPEAGALRAVLAFPSTYSVGITSLGFQVVWATLARRADVDVRRLFTDQGDPPHGGQRGRGPRLDLFGLSLSWELDGPVLLEFVVTEDENCFPMVPPGASLQETVDQPPMLQRDTQAVTK